MTFTDPPTFSLFEHIARRIIGIRTLRNQGRDSLDFHQVSVFALLDMMQSAYDAGFDAGSKAGQS